MVFQRGSNSNKQLLNYVLNNINLKYSNKYILNDALNGYKYKIRYVLKKV